MVSFLLLTDHRLPPPAEVKEEWTKEQVKVPLTVAGWEAPPPQEKPPASSLGNQEKVPSVAFLALLQNTEVQIPDSFIHTSHQRHQKSPHLIFLDL